MASFRDDFAKYARRQDPHVLDALLGAVARQIGGKFVYARAGGDRKHGVVERALELLERAGWSRSPGTARRTASRWAPRSGSETGRRCCSTSACFTPCWARPPGPPSPAPTTWARPCAARSWTRWPVSTFRCLDRAGGAAPSLHDWQRGGGRAGEIDHLVQVGVSIVPVEVKAGAAGAMKSLHQVMHDKQLGLALRVDTNPPSLQELDVKTTQGDRVRYRLLSLPASMLHLATGCMEVALEQDG